MNALAVTVVNLARVSSEFHFRPQLRIVERNRLVLLLKNGECECAEILIQFDPIGCDATFRGRLSSREESF